MDMGFREQCMAHAPAALVCVSSLPGLGDPAGPPAQRVQCLPGGGVWTAAPVSGPALPLPCDPGEAPGPLPASLRCGESCPRFRGLFWVWGGRWEEEEGVSLQVQSGGLRPEDGREGWVGG